MSGLQVGVKGAAELLRTAERLAFFMHVNPDGDSIGSTLGLVRLMRQQLKKDCVVVQVDPAPRIFDFLPGLELFTPWTEVQGDFDLAVFLDCGDLGRVGAALPIVERCKQSLNIDHHVTNAVYGDYNYLDFEAAAVGELAYLLIEELGLALDPEAALCLYTSLVTDTGSFQYANTTPRTHRIAAKLIEAGAAPYQVASALYERQSLPRLALLARALQSLNLHYAGQVATIEVARADLVAAGARDEEAEGIVDYARSVEGVEVGVFLREQPDGQIRVGLRSRSRVDVGALASQLGGGGHARAAGCTLPGPLPQARQQVLQQLKEVLGPSKES